MNLLEGSLERQANAWCFRSGSLSLPLPPFSGTLPDPLASRTILGIRPEDILLRATDSRGISVKAHVDVVENLGADQVLHLNVGDRHLVVRVPQGERHGQGATLTLHQPYKSLHLFLDDRRLNWADPDERA